MTGPAGLGNRPRLEALAVALPDVAVEDAIERTGAREQRRRLLPTHLVVTLVVGMGLWAEAPRRHVLAEVVEGWREVRARRADALGTAGASGRRGWRLPSTAAIVQARQRVGARLFRELFHAVAGPIATPETAGAFLGGLRLVALDGTTLDVADTPANDDAFGRPTPHRGPGACPQVRVVARIETGPHARCDVVLRPFRGGEAPAARHLLRSVGPGMLLLWDRGFDGYAMVQQTLARQAHFLGRTKADIGRPVEHVLPDGSFLRTIDPSPKARRHRQDGIVVRVVEDTLDTAARRGTERYRLVTSLLDPALFPADVLATTYHERWEIETTLDEVKVHQWAHPRPLRSKHPREVVQEVYGRLLAHLAIRTLMYHAALQDGGRSRPPELHRRLARAAPRHPARPAHAAQAAPPFGQRLLTELAAERVPPRRPRSNPRAVKRKMSNFPRKRPPPPTDTPPASAAAAASIRILRP